MTIFIIADLDECTSANHNCHVNATCLNNQGSFSCKCKSGYTGNGVSCTGKFGNCVKAFSENAGYK